MFFLLTLLQLSFAADPAFDAERVVNELRGRHDRAGMLRFRDTRLDSAEAIAPIRARLARTSDPGEQLGLAMLLVQVTLDHGDLGARQELVADLGSQPVDVQVGILQSLRRADEQTVDMAVRSVPASAAAAARESVQLLIAGHAQGVRWESTVLRGLEDVDVRVQAAALRASRIHHVGSIDTIAALVDAGDPQVRYQSLMTLRTLAPDRLDALRPSLASETDPRIRQVLDR